uniref:Uncharacterized protein n=1 Tax=Ananas comosus var. bracteatus TaxID=296719 RepID=A0A6V7QHM1_ANACO|nr:unnamed protein product [Ananas comosus var. bracteatus]
MRREGRAFSEEICKIAVFLLAVPVQPSRCTGTLQQVARRLLSGWHVYQYRGPCTGTLEWISVGAFVADVALRSRPGIRLLPLHREEAGRGGVFAVLDVARRWIRCRASTVSVSARTRRRNVGFRLDLVRWIQDFERNPRSPYLLDLLRVSWVEIMFSSAAVFRTEFELDFSVTLVLGCRVYFYSSVQAVPDCWVPSELTVDSYRFLALDSCESGMNLTEILVNSLGRTRECHSGMRFQCDECRSFCWTVLEPATLGVVYGAARYRLGGSVLGSPGEIVSDAFPYL